MTSRLLTASNQITLLRLAFVPVFAILVMDRSYRAALVVLMVAAISDVLDGALARLLKQVSPLGVALDPIADKILMTTGYLTMSFRGALPWWLTIVVLTRDVGILMTALLISLVAGYRPFYPTPLGKASTGVQMATIFAAVSYQAQVPHIGAELVRIFVYLTAALTLASGVHYLIVVRQRYGQHEGEDPTRPESS
jgi:cardiolipin synthase